MFSLLNSFRITAFLEGLSFILLLGVAMPIKYLADDPSYVSHLGMYHGILFVLYIALAILVAQQFKWSRKTTIIVLAAAIIPFGTFYIDYKYLKNKLS
ncbi:DUF3817 domain-containing protein [Psychroserpens sp.]|uniref:DUF3817 domain-containing protein n=1 Tax=Psychroserpens sp. TaxID=2020870 RepID=UPI001B0C6D42|nr:DUF3817 domain-containing protein [Psychroserpens sp.]MBO6606424.1 DUF3817 domain-containing protein [Psychroserpens sp.]MBO6653128.1 DUF3817 domain-containing protein [Psychroserpens sp.]MBO6680844.1 DUF3817 domain-containing protein [Psychroserpens sp.]MBO6750198.1 DUF3817 domain-containing protein [Psychroserpens sp.]MBO6914679.1 DUF3817 domain-containing protein [Psychroserpens sp.]